jgi:hypothetical protein
MRDTRDDVVENGYDVVGDETSHERETGKAQGAAQQGSDMGFNRRGNGSVHI